MRKKFIVANWKMNANKSMLETMFTQLIKGWKDKAVRMIIAPPFPYLSKAADLLIASKEIKLAGQNMASEEKGAFTGEVSASMLLDCCCEYVIIGHSERRTLYSEHDNVIARKYKIALKLGLKPILCVGENLVEREQGQVKAIILRQLHACLTGASLEDLRRTIIAYEPVWAIGTGMSATPTQAEEVHDLIRSRLDQQKALHTPILYGGSVKATNASDLFCKPLVDGALVGGASLDASEFLDIARMVECSS